VKDNSLSDFKKQHRDTIDKALRTQMEYYFGDKNYSKDTYLQKQQSLNEERFIELGLIMRFNKIRKLTKSREQVLRAI
jgi:hypothetical protein